LELIYIGCSAIWKIFPKENSCWKIEHKGDHNHPAPFPVRATNEWIAEARKLLENDPKMTITKLQAGIDTRKSISEVDVKFASNNYLKHIKIRQQRKRSTTVYRVAIKLSTHWIQPLNSLDN
jgi:hypothetical protein